jgi:light-regulated signal transduction histidine kinase (bacteriophytochrome)
MQAVDLTNCDDEPIQIPGSILPHGAMLVVDCATFAVIQAAGDTDRLVGLPIAALLGHDVGCCLTSGQVVHLRHLSESGSLEQPIHFLDPSFRVVPGCPADASVHRSDGALVIEWEAADLNDPYAADPLAAVRAMLRRTDSTVSTAALCTAAAEAVRATTGFDRVMVYRFLDDASGRVIAESKADHMPSFLDHHFPASDIPIQARALYARTILRLIPEVDYVPAPLVPTLNSATGRPLDMSFATLRDVSPVHREYLRNMGVGASMSISVMRGHQLWGLIACHHMTARRLPRHLRAACELFGMTFSLQLESRDRAETLSMRQESRAVMQVLMQDLAKEDDYGQGLLKQANRLLQYIHADGIGARVSDMSGFAMQIGGSVSLFGATPPDEVVHALADWLSQRMLPDEVFRTDRLGKLWPAAAPYAAVASGLLAISVAREPCDFILWFRPEVVRTITWSGDPTKPAELGPNGERLTPRKSFEAWKETVYGRSSPWSTTDVDAAFDLRIALVDVVLRRLDGAAREQARAREKEQLLLAELDHRVKNTLAVVQSLVRQTGRSAKSLKEYLASLEQRIRSMARSHSLLTKSRWEGVSLRALLEEETGHLDQAVAGSLTLTGADFMLDPKTALALSLALHELATNAAKYGALSSTSGRVTVTWGRDANADLTILWVESGGPEVRSPQRRGFGSTLIERALALETGGQSTLHFLPGGIRCDIVLPWTTVVSPEIPSGAENMPVMDPVVLDGSTPICAPRILVVEDAALVVMLIEELVADLGWTLVGPATRLADAVSLARGADIDVAILDVNLAGEFVWEAAEALQDRAIPFLFSTGYDSESVLPSRFAGSPIISKPFLLEDLECRLREMVAKRQSRSQSGGAH